MVWRRLIDDKLDWLLGEQLMSRMVDLSMRSEPASRWSWDFLFSSARITDCAIVYFHFLVLSYNWMAFCMAMKKPNLCLGAVSLFLPCNISKYRQTVPLLHMEPIIHQGDQVAVQGDGLHFSGSRWLLRPRLNVLAAQDKFSSTFAGNWCYPLSEVLSESLGQWTHDACWPLLTCIWMYLILALWLVSLSFWGLLPLLWCLRVGILQGHRPHEPDECLGGHGSHMFPPSDMQLPMSYPRDGLWTSSFKKTPGLDLLNSIHFSKSHFLRPLFFHWDGRRSNFRPVTVPVELRLSKPGIDLLDESALLGCDRLAQYGAHDHGVQLPGRWVSSWSIGQYWSITWRLETQGPTL